MSKYILGLVIFTLSACKSLIPFSENTHDGAPSAQYELGKRFLFGIAKVGIGGRGEWWIYPDRTKALNWLEQAAERGEVRAQFLLGDIYQGNKSGPKDILQFEQALERENVNLGLSLPNIQQENRSNTNDSLAYMWYRQAAEQGHVLAQHRLGEIYENGWGTEQSYEEARRWYLKAAEKGLVNSSYRLAVLYLYGKGVEKNDDEARKWLTNLSRSLIFIEDKKSAIVIASKRLLGAMDIHQEGVKDGLVADKESNLERLFRELYGANEEWMREKCQNAGETLKTSLFCNRE